MNSVCVVGLGYVGFPLLYLLSKYTTAAVSGFDVNTALLQAAENGEDHTGMVPADLRAENHEQIRFCRMAPRGQDIYIICVPTPDKKGVPDYSYVKQAMLSVLCAMRPDSVIILESTVAPATVRTLIMPMVRDAGFSAEKTLVVYSPERVNPSPTAFEEMPRCVKVISTDHAELPTLRVVVDLYREVFDGVVVFNDSRVAELAKCFENMQRDVNIALMNELSMVCLRDGISFSDVVQALRTKQSSPVFTSGMVGGHCIPVDPYYLSDYYNKVFENRKQFPSLGRWINEEFIRTLAVLADQTAASGAAILIYGATYKPDVNDSRNSGSLKLAKLLQGFGRKVVVIDPVLGMYGDTTTTPIDLVIGAVFHRGAPAPNWTEPALTIDCKFINIGGVFEAQHLSPFKTVINV